MLSKWVGTRSGSTTVDKFRNFSSTNEDGSMRSKTWFKAVPDELFDAKNSENQDDKELWYYADARGKLAYSEIKTINGRKYAFNEKGAMLTGLWYLTVDSSNKIATGSNATVELDSESKLNEYTKLSSTAATFSRPSSSTPKSGLYYFGDESDGSMKTGNVNVTIDGESYAFKFRTSGDKGVGIDGLDGSTYYVNGKKVKADSDDKYKVFVVNADNKVVAEVSNSVNLVDRSLGDNKIIGSRTSFVPTGIALSKCVVVSSSGALQGRGEKKDGNEVHLVVNASKELVGAYISK